MLQPGCTSDKLILFAVFLICFIKNLGISQTYISPLIGCDVQKIVSNDPRPSYGFDEAKSGYAYANPLVGLKIRQKILGPFYLSYIGDYTYKNVDGYFHGGIYEHLVYHYNYFRNTLSLMYMWNNTLYLEIGPSYNIVYKLYYEHPDNDIPVTPIRNFINEHGIMISAGIKYKKYDLGIYYYRRNIEYSNNIYYDFIHEVHALGIRLAYDFKILNGFKKGNKLECPDINKKTD